MQNYHQVDVVPKLRNDPLFHAFFFSKMTDALILLEKSLLNTSSPIKKAELISPYINIIGQQANHFAEELLLVLNRPAPAQEHFHPLQTSDAHELLLIACIWLGLPKLFNAIFIRLEGFSKNIIKEFYLVALQRRIYEVFETLQQISPPADLIRLALLAKSPERIVNLLWQNLEETGKPYALRDILKGLAVSEEGDIEKLPEPFKTYYEQNSNSVFTNFEEKKLDQFHEIPLSDLLLPAESYTLSQLSTLITEKKFSAFFLAIKKGTKLYGDEYFFQIIIEHLTTNTDVEFKSENGRIQKGIRFLQLIKNISNLIIMHFFFNYSGINNLKLKQTFSLIYSEQYYDLPAQFLVKKLLQRECISPRDEKFLRTLLYFNNQNNSSQHEDKLQIKLSNLFDGRILPFELKAIDSRIKTMSLSEDSELEFKLLFPKSQDFSQQPLIQIFPSDIWQLVAEYLSSANEEENDWYNQFITWLPTAGPLSFTQKQITKLQTYIAKIQEFQNELIELQESKHSLIKKNNLHRILYLAIMFLEGLGIAGLSLGLHFIKLSKSRQRHAILASQDWQPCPPHGFDIYDYSVSTAPSLSHAVCDNSSYGDYSPCNQLCDSFNSIGDFSSSLRIGLIIGLVVILIMFCMSCFCSGNLFEAGSLEFFSEIRTKIEIFCRDKLNRSSLPKTPNELYNALEDEKLRLSGQIPSLENPPRNHSIAIRPSQNGYILLPGGDEKDQDRKKSENSNYGHENFGIN